MEIVRSNTAAATAGQKLTALLHARQGTPTLLLVSGGSALTILEHVAVDTLGSWLTLSVLDERYSPDPAERNFNQLQTTGLYQQALQQGVNIIDPLPTNDLTLKEAGERFADALMSWRAAHPEGRVTAIMGVGADGHTAGIFAGEYGVDFAGDEWVVAYSVPQQVSQYTDRITVSYTFLRTQVAEALVYAVGEAKQPVITQLEQGDCTEDVMPAYIVKALPCAVLVTD